MRRSDRRQRATRATTLALTVLALWGSGGCRSIPEPDAAAPARAHLEAGRVEEAVREIERAVRSRPHDTALRLQAADVLAETGRPERAIAHLETALRLAPRDAEVSIRLGELERERGNLPDAYVAFRRANELDPDALRAVSGLALAAEALGFAEEAERAYARWAELEARGAERR